MKTAIIAVLLTASLSTIRALAEETSKPAASTEPTPAVTPAFDAEPEPAAEPAVPISAFAATPSTKIPLPKPRPEN